MKSGPSKFTSALGAVVSTFLAVDLVSSLLKLGTTDTGPTPDQKAFLTAQDEERKAEIAKQDAMLKDMQLQEDRRKMAAAPAMG